MIFRGKGIDMGWVFFEEKVGTQALSAQIGTKNRIRNGFDSRLFLRKIDSEQSIKEAFHPLHLKRNGGFKSRLPLQLQLSMPLQGENINFG
jgi:hypothetical protein